MNSPGPGSAGSNLDTFPSVPGDPSHVLCSAPFISFAWGVMPPGMGNVGSGFRGQLRSGGELQPVRCPPSFLPCAWRGWVGAGTDFFPPYPCLWATVTFHLAPALSRLISVELESTCGGVWRGFGGSTSLRDLLARWAGPVPPNAQRVYLINYRRCCGTGRELLDGPGVFL